MNEREEIARRLSEHCPGRWSKNYTKSKLKWDPLYEALFEEIGDTTAPLLDLGCGMGLLACYLRERGSKMPVTGIDYDARKIADGIELVRNGDYHDITLSQGDAKEVLPEHQGTVTILDILQFFEPDEQAKLLRRAASRVAPGCSLVIRSGLREKNWRFFITWMGDLLAKATFWMRNAPTHYPDKETFRKILEEEELEVSISPLWGKTPFNNYLIVATSQKTPLAGA